jgi:hypothetical protein
LQAAQRQSKNQFSITRTMLHSIAYEVDHLASALSVGNNHEKTQIRRTSSNPGNHLGNMLSSQRSPAALADDSDDSLCRGKRPASVRLSAGLVE